MLFIKFGEHAFSHDGISLSVGIEHLVLPKSDVTKLTSFLLYLIFLRWSTVYDVTKYRGISAMRNGKVIIDIPGQFCGL